MHTVLGERWKGAGYGCALSVASLCLGFPVVTSRAQAEVSETRTGWLGRGDPGRSGKRGGAGDGRPQETEAVCPGMGTNGFGS